MNDDRNTHYEFSYEVESYTHDIVEEPVLSPVTVPLNLFTHTSVMQALSRYLVDVRAMSFTEVARMLDRSPKSIWASYHQTKLLPSINEQSLPVPLHIFTDRHAPLEALVLYLKKNGLRNVDIARVLGRSPKTTHTVAQRGEVKR